MFEIKLTHKSLKTFKMFRTKDYSKALEVFERWDKQRKTIKSETEISLTKIK